MSSIEERVVGMRFDSSKFQSGIKPAIDGLDKLKSSLKLDGATKAIDELDAAGKRFSLAGVAGAAEGVSLKFVALATIGITALTNIANKAINAGEILIKSLTIDPIKAGLDEYELKMGSIQTILANTARYNTGLPEVVASLDELNNYADKTIYNFGDMTKNIGLFTNAGLGIKDATSLIKGFSNESAASGVSAQGAAGAAYQLSQALSAGQVRLIDWRSLTNVGLGNKNMQQGILDIASAMGTMEGKSVTAADIQGDFNGSLEKGWLTADVMSNYLKIMAGDMDFAAQSALGLSDDVISRFDKQQNTAEEAATKVRTYTQLLGTMRESVGSGWSQSFDIIIGDFNEATDLFTNVNNALGGIVGEISDSRNKLLQDFKDLGGRDVAILAIKNAFQAVLQIIKPIQRGLETVFPAVTGKNLLTIVQAVERFTASLKITGTTSKNIERTSAGFFAILSIGAQIIGKLIGVLADLLGQSTDGAEGILDFTGNIGDFLVSVDEALKKGTGLTKFFAGLSNVLSVVVGVIRTVVGVIFDFVASLGSISSTGVDGFADRMQDRFASFGEFFKGIQNILAGFGRAIQTVAGFFEPFIERISSLAQGLGSALSDSLKTGNFDTVLDFINTGLLTGVGLLIFKFIKSMKESFGKITPPGGFKEIIKGVFGELGNTLQAMQGQIKAKTLLTIAGAVAILTLSVIALSLIDSGKLFIALGAITVMFTQLGLVMMAFDRMFTVMAAAKLTLISAAMIGIATAMLIFAGAVAILGNMKTEDLIRGLAGLAGALTIVSIAMLLMSKVGPGAILGSAALVIASVGLLVLAGALKLYATMSWDDIGRAMTVLGGSLLILAVGLTLMAGSLPGAAALVVASVGLAVLAGALLLFAMLSWDDIGRAMTTLGGTLAILAIGLTLMVAALPGAAALVVASVGLAVIAGVLKIFGTMDWESVGKAMTLLGGTLGILALGLTLMVAALPGAIALVVAAGALAILAPVLLVLGSMSWEQIGTGLGALALTLGLLAIAGYALIPAIPGLLGLGAAILLLGVGVLAAGIGIAVLSIGLTGLAVAGGAAIAVLTAAISAIATLIPFVAQQIGLGLIEIIKIIGQSGPELLVALTAILLAVIGAIVAIIPPAIQAIILLVILLVGALVKLIPLLATAGMKLIIGILDGIAKNIGKVITKGTDVIVAFLDGIGKAIPRIANAAAGLIIDFVNGLATAIRNNTDRMNTAGRNLAGAIVDGMTSGLRGGVNAIVEGARRLVSNIPTAIKKVLGIASPSKVTTKLGEQTGEGVVDGLTNTIGSVRKAGTYVGTAAMMSLKKSMADAGNFMTMQGMDAQPTIRPVLDLSAIKKDAGLIGGIIGGQTLAVDGATARANEISSKYGEYQQAMVDANGPSTEVNMTQNNYSPKALPAAEIYRQNKNQMSILKGELEKNV